MNILCRYQGDSELAKRGKLYSVKIVRASILDRIFHKFAFYAYHKDGSRYILFGAYESEKYFTKDWKFIRNLG